MTARQRLRQKRFRYSVFLGLVAALWLLIAPPRWWLNLTKPVDLSDPAASGRCLVVQYDCRSCHRIDGRGAALAPDLAGVTGRLNEASLQKRLRNPRSGRKETPMPNFRLSDGEIEAIISYLREVDAQ
ncbi:MAG: c-type cytochrome [Anaerolineae bacterium]